MFTGIVEELGKVKNIETYSNGKISIYAEKIMENMEIGDSIAVNGVCLTVSDFNDSFFTADIMAETFRYTNLKFLYKNTYVNLERAATLSRKLGGHLVSGHIDDIGKILNIHSEGASTWFTIEADKNILKYIIFKGSICIDGISLTAAKVQNNSFSISVTPHTIKNTTLLQKKIGDTVNIETDLISKYVEKLLYSNQPDCQKSNTNISMDFLIKNGF